MGSYVLLSHVPSLLLAVVEPVCAAASLAPRSEQVNRIIGGRISGQRSRFRPGPRWHVKETKKAAILQIPHS